MFDKLEDLVVRLEEICRNRMWQMTRNVSAD